MRECCRREADRHLRKHRDVATCEGCGALLLAYGNSTDYQRMVAELQERGAAFSTSRNLSLNIVARDR